MPHIKNFITVGKIQNTVGIRGYIKIKILTDFPERFFELTKVKLFNEVRNSFIKNEVTGNEDFIIEDIKLFNDNARILFRYYTSPESAVKLKDSLILIEEKNKMKLKKNSFYFFDLIGCEVSNKGKIIGKVLSVENYGSDDMLNILSYDNNKEFLLPLVKNFVKRIDIIKKNIEVELIEGFIE